MEKYFWQMSMSFILMKYTADWIKVSNYRGQNANMHSCEALNSCFEATNEQKYLG